MSRPSSASPFPFNSKKEWSQAAKQELEGEDPLEKLKKRIDEIDILPYYDAANGPVTNFQLPISQNEFLGPRTWFNLPLISVADAKQANELALLSLNAGADGILFDLLEPVDPAVLLKKIELPYCSIVFLTGDGHEDFFMKLADLAKSRKYATQTLQGAIFWKQLPANQEVTKIFTSWNQFHSLGIIADDHRSASTIVASLLAKAVTQLDEISNQDDKINTALNSITFSVPIGQDLFLEIAKLKALRLLWQLVTGSYDPNHSRAVNIHAEIKVWKNKSFEPQENLISSTTAAMSAILGGCDSITVHPEDPDSSMMSRIARNVSSIFREESHLGKVADPTAGSYYLDTLTDQLGREAWKKFQDRMK